MESTHQLICKMCEGDKLELFLDLGDKIEFDGSMRNFYATANTTIPNDQRGFAEFCFGDMPSCKEGDGLQCTKDNPRYTNY